MMSSLSSEPSPMPPATRRLRDYALISLRGLLMGAADAVPGVSGGTIAFITGIYPELLASLRSPSSSQFWHYLRRGQFAAWWRWVHGNFLLALGLGIVTALLLMVRGLEPLLLHHPMLVWSFFFGLIAASVIVVLRQVRHWRSYHLPLLLGAALLMFVMVSLRPAQTPEAPWFLLLCGVLAVTALVLPGVSGALILVLLGKYNYIIEAVHQRELVPLLWLGAGAVIGVVLFARLLSWLLRHRRDITLVILAGLIVGSLRSVYPWQQLNTRGASSLLLPPSLTQLLLALALAALGFGLVWGLERWSGGVALSAEDLKR